MKAERVQKILAAAGLGSRRACERMVSEGRVTVNGKTAQLGDRANPQRDEIRVDGEVLHAAEKKIYLAIYKPRGVLSAAKDLRGRKTVVDLAGVEQRVYPVGRLDLDSEGLMILTNDGALALELSHPRYEQEKEYRVLIEGRMSEAKMERWRRGVELQDGFSTGPVRVSVEGTQGRDTWVKVVMKEGHKRQIRESVKSLGGKVKRLVRTRIGAIEIGALKPGEQRTITPGEIKRSLNRPPAPKSY